MDATEIVTLPPETPISIALTCQKCGCHDSSVRQVIYPYVISIFVLTFRHEFHGRWCWKHRTLYFLLAALITGTIGLLGFPLGLIYAPTTLIRLARGTVMHKASNLKLLRSLAEAHQQRGLLDGARRCLEDSLQFVDDLWGRQELARSYSLSSSAAPGALPGEPFRSGSASFGTLLSARLFTPLGLFASAVIFSGLAGILSHYADKIFDLPMGRLNIALGPILLWIPFAAVGLVLIFGLRQILEKTLQEHPFTSPVPILGLALGAGLLAAYGFLEGRQIGTFLDILQDQPVLPAGPGLWTMLGAVLTRGGILEIPQELSGFEFWNSIHHLLLAAIPVSFPAVLILAAWPYVKWEKLLKEIHAQVPAPLLEFSFTPLLGRLAPLLGFACMVGLLFPVPQQSVVDFVEARDHFYTGNGLANREQFSRAISEYKTAVQLDPSFAEAYIELGWAYYQKDDNVQAIAQYTRALELTPKRVSAHYELGRIYYNDDQPEKAALEFEKALQLDAGYYRAYLGMGWVAYDQGDLEKAETNFRKVLSYNDKMYDAYIGLGYIYQDRDQVDQEISAYQQAAASNPSSGEAHTLLGMAYYDKNELDLAVTSLKKGISLENDNQLARLYLSQAYIYTGDPDTAVSFGRETIKLLPEWAGGHALLAMALIETRQVDAGAAQIQAAQGIADKTDSDRRLIIRALLNAGKPKEAEVETQAAIKDGQHPANFYMYLAEAYADQENYTQALATCDQAAKAGARSADILLQRASIHLDQDQAELSLDEARQALTLEPKSAYAHYMMSLVYSNQDNDASALGEAQQAVSLDRYASNAFLHLAATQLSLGNAKESISAAARAALLLPYGDVPHYFLGMAYLFEGLDRQAAVELQKFLDLYDGSASKQGMKEDVEKALKRLSPTI